MLDDEFVVFFVTCSLKVARFFNSSDLLLSFTSSPNFLEALSKDSDSLVEGVVVVLLLLLLLVLGPTFPKFFNFCTSIAILTYIVL